ncbi:MAG: flagellar hook-length control protein FliK [Clostridiales bacterium]|nr:flagellar hook-length control protein FliK [Clostridiales bacterium]
MTEQITRNALLTPVAAALLGEAERAALSRLLEGGRLLAEVKNLAILVPGDVFKARVTDIQQDRVTIYAGGESLTARSVNLPEARIGSDAYFSVKSTGGGQIVLEMVRQDALLGGVAKEALDSAGLPGTLENSKLVRLLMENGLPIDGETLQKAAFFRYSGFDAELPREREKLLFLLKEGFAPSKASVSALEGVLSEKGNLAALIARVLPKLRAADGGGALKRFAERMNPLEVRSKDDLLKAPEFLRELRKTAEAAAKSLSEPALEKSGAEGREELLRDLEDIKTNLDFAGRITSKEYVALPINVDGEPRNLELFVFRDGKNGAAKPPGERASVLLALDLPSLSRVEVYIAKNGRELAVQFKSDKKESLFTLSAEQGVLAEALNNSGYTLRPITFMDIKEPFNVCKEPGGGEDGAKPPRRRYSFDMRV